MFPLRAFVLRIWILAVLAAGASWAQTPASAPAPFLFQAPTIATGVLLADEVSAQNALELGFPSLAAATYGELLNQPVANPEARNRLVIGLVTALLDDGRATEAEQALARYIGAPSPAYRLRLAMIDVRNRRYDAATLTLSGLKVEDFSPGDRSWWLYVQGILAETTKGHPAELYQQAIDAATSAMQRSYFVLAREQARLLFGEASEQQVKTLRLILDRNSGSRLAYKAVSDLAVVYNALGRRNDAITLLTSQLQGIPQDEHQYNDQWRLLLGLIAGPSDPTGRNALRNLLLSGADRDRQRVALRLLAGNSKDSARRDQEFAALLDQLIGQPNQHPILDDLLLFRAEFALAGKDEKGYRQAEADANQLLSVFPGSPLKANAYGIQMSIAWEQERYRIAADRAAKARAELPAGETRARLGVLVAEAYFRAKDYPNAADAYGSALSEIPADVKPGELMFQRVIAEIEANRVDQAEALLDDLSRDLRFDAIDRWQTEWNLVRVLQAQGQASRAYDRVNRLLSTPIADAGLVGLQARMRWLQARLALQAGDPQRALALAQQLLLALNDVEPELKSAIASTTLLLQAEATLALDHNNRNEAAFELLRKLRGDFPKSEAAVYSYIVEADAYAKRGLFVDAQNSLTRLADEFQGEGYASYAAYALYQAAGYAEQLAQTANLREANTLLERLFKQYPNSDLVFYARLKQGDVLRKLIDFGHAQQTYELLVNTYSQHPGVYAAELALADCHAWQAANDVSHQESATSIYERLLDRATVPIDVRVEAGFKTGNLYFSRGAFERAAKEVWWPLVNRFLLDDEAAAKLGATGRYWMSRTLVQLGEALKRLGRPEEARQAYELLLKKKLPGEAAARAFLATSDANPPPKS